VLFFFINILKITMRAPSAHIIHQT